MKCRIDRLLPVLVLVLCLAPCGLYAQQHSTFKLPHDHLVPKGTWHAKGIEGEGEEWDEDQERVGRGEKAQLAAARQLAALESTGMLDVLRQRTAPAQEKRLDQWVRLGPVGGFGSPRRNGRISGLQLMPDGTSDYQVFAGACQGGLWTMHTQNFAQWLDIGRNLPNPSVRAFAVDPDDYQRIIVGTGDFKRYKGAGMFETLDGGASWQPIAMPSEYNGSVPDHFFKVIFVGNDPGTGSKRWVAAGGLGPLYSSDDGSTWHCGVHSDNFHIMTKLCSDMVQVPGRAGWLWAAICDSGTQDNESGIYLSTDYGVSWSKHFSSSFPAGEDWRRATLAICRDSIDNLAFAVTGPDNTLMKVCRSTDGGNTWSEIYAGAFGGNQASHTLSLVIKPDDPDWIALGAVTVLITFDGGSSWSKYIDPGHADVTHLAFDDLSGTDIMWICNDGGLYYYDLVADDTYDVLGDDATGLANSEIDFMDAKGLCRGIGMQDNGTCFSSDGGNTWSSLMTGDGGDFEIVEPATGESYFILGVYSETPNWHTLHYLNGAVLTNGSLNNYMPRLYYSHFLDKLYANGADGLYYIDSPPGLSFQVMVTDLQPDAYSARGIFGNRAQDDALWVNYWGDHTTGEGDEDLTFVYKDGDTWIKRHLEDFNSTGHVVETVFMSREWRGEAWVGLENPENPVMIKHTTDFGQTWSDVTGNLTAVAAINAIEVMPFDPQTIFVGTDLGMYRTTDGGVSWYPYMEGLPIGRCRELKFVEDKTMGTAHSLVLATDGRGLWKRDITMPPVVYVDKRNAGGVEDGTFEYPFATVAAGVAAAPSGAIVAIRTGFYHEPQIYNGNVKLVTWAGTTTID